MHKCMDKSDSSFDWNHMRAFAATAELGSLSAAARHLGLTQPTVGRQVAALEDDLGVTLFERVGRGLSLTQSGRDLLPHARTMSEAATRLSLVASRQSQSIDGMVRITASDIFSAYLLPDIVAQIRQVAPKLDVELVATNDLADLLRREADIAIRHVRPDQPDLTARLLCEATAGLYATPKYLRQRGTPQELSDLTAHDFVGFGNIEQAIGYFANVGITVTPENFTTRSANGLVSWQLVRAGFGISPMSSSVARLTPEVVPVLPDMEPIRFPVWLVTHRELHTSRRIRLVFDLLAEMLSDARL